MKERETITSLLHTMSLIREAAGLGGEFMLSELPDIIKKLRKERDQARKDRAAYRVEIQLIASQRDEARRLVCELAAEYKAEMFCPKGTMVPKSDRALAKAYGWDCFSR